MEKVQTKGNKQDNQNSISNGGTISQMIMESPLMQQREREHNEMFGEASQLMAKDSNMPIQRVRAKLTNETDYTAYTNLGELSKKFKLKLQNIRVALFNKFKTNARIPDSYMDSALILKDTQNEVILMLNNLVNDSNGTMIADSGDSATFINQFYNAVSNLIDNAFVANYPYLKKANAFANDYATYINNLNTIKTKLTTYKSEKKKADTTHYDPLKSEQMEVRIAKLKIERDTLANDLDTAMTNNAGIDAVVTRYNDFVTQINSFENFWDNVTKLDYDYVNDDVSTTLDNFIADANNEDVTNKYAEGGGVDDGMNVDDVYSVNLACSLYTILALKPNWMGAGNDPKKLHEILRKTQNFKDYDDDKKVAYIRYLAGLTPTAKSQGLGQFLDGRGNDKSSFIVDPDNQAHTFAVVYKNGNYKKVDNETQNGGNIDRSVKMITIWQ